MKKLTITIYDDSALWIKQEAERRHIQTSALINHLIIEEKSRIEKLIEERLKTEKLLERLRTEKLLRYVHGGDLHYCDWRCHA